MQRLCQIRNALRARAASSQPQLAFAVLKVFVCDTVQVLTLECLVQHHGGGVLVANLHPPLEGLVGLLVQIKGVAMQDGLDVSLWHFQLACEHLPVLANVLRNVPQQRISQL